MSARCTSACCTSACCIHKVHCATQPIQLEKANPAALHQKLTTLRISFRWPPSPCMMATQTFVLMFHSLRAWSCSQRRHDIASGMSRDAPGRSNPQASMPSPAITSDNGQKSGLCSGVQPHAL